MKQKYWVGMMWVGTFIAVASPVMDIVSALQGVDLPSSFWWACSMIGVAIVALGVVFALDSIGKHA